MYFHLGEDVLVRTQEIIAILDKESFQASTDMQEFFDFHEKQLINLAKGSFKSLVITNNKIYLSPFASGTIKKRSLKLTIQ